MSVNAVIHMVILLWSIVIATKIAKKEKEVIPINRDLAFLFYVILSILFYEIPYNIAKTWLAPEWAFSVTIVILFILQQIVRRRNVN
jgi:hypothetical protein